jgi:hypothetical protein
MRRTLTRIFGDVRILETVSSKVISENVKLFFDVVSVKLGLHHVVLSN